MKKLLLLLIITITLSSCNVSQNRTNIVSFITAKETAQLPVRIQNYSIKSPNLIDIIIDSVHLSYGNEESIIPLCGYISTKWKFKKDYSLEPQYHIFSDDYNSDYEFEYKKYLIPLNNFDNIALDGTSVDYLAEWPLDNPFKK